jgi:Bacterial capsule synthesis protein PGA_cap
MSLRMILTGDVNLMNVTDPKAPFARVIDELRQADAVFSNLECCLVETPAGHSVSNEGFFADPAVGGEALKLAGIHAVGIANNVHYGDRNIEASIGRLDQLGILHAGAGADVAAARAPVILERNGVRFGFLQRSSVYWPTNHEARKDAAGIAVIRGHTAYHVPMFKTRVEVPPPNRPGIPPDIITWADAAYLGWFKEDVWALRPRVDVLVASCHWGLGKDVLQYMTDIAHAAIDAGADIVVGPRAALFAPDRGVQGQADLLRARQFLVPHRPRRTQARRLGRHAGAGDRGPGGDRAGHVSVRPAQRPQRDRSLRHGQGGRRTGRHRRAQRAVRHEVRD